MGRGASTAAGAAPIAARELLALWEQAAGLPPLPRLLALASSGGMSAEELAARPIGHAYAEVVRLRGALTGAPLEATASCPACGAVAEFALESESLLAWHDAAGAGAAGTRWRLPTVGDLASVADLPDAAEQTGALLQRCLVDADATTELSSEDIAAIEAAMMAADPLAEVHVAVRCPDCGDDLDCALDLGEFVWAELDARARRLLHEVDLLARAYGWSEPEILALSEFRRAAYLRLVLDGAP